uniref:Uncharacterized protein n=1 Tax=virus sp. ctr1v16 TaxID=2825823 RepID=A0A8S5RQI2_9VIRU|nr:MAG TPA: hypothetical protein [virus sp. ctr1v16]
MSANTHIHKSQKSLAKQDISGQIKEKQNNEKNTFHLPRHSSFMIMHTFADWGNTGQNMAENLGITTVSTTKAHGRNRDKGKNSLVVGDYLRQCNSSFIKM